MFTKAELESANLQLHARFLSLSDQIRRELAQLERNIAAAPPTVRAPVLAAAAQIASTQQRLLAHTQHLPPSPLQRFEILSSSLDAQQGALQHLSLIVKQHAPSDRPVAAPPAAIAAPVPLRPPETRRTPCVSTDSAPPPQEPRGWAEADVATLARHFQATAPPPAEHHAPRHSADAHELPPAWTQHQRRSHVMRRNDRERWGLRPLLAMAQQQIAGTRPRQLGWATTLVAAAIFGYMLPHGGEGQDALVKPVAAASPRMEPGAAPRATAPAPPPVATAVESAPPVPTYPAPSPPQADPPIAAAAPLPGIPRPAEPALPLLSAAKSTVPSTPSPAPDAAVAPAPQKPASKVEVEPAASPANAAKEGFVPVVFTHRDESAVLSFFTELQQKFPRLLAGRQAQAQPVDLGDKGVWHRLVLLPPRPRPYAMKVCDQLLTAGYDRCWVKVY